jgi:hypothetical protein
MPQPSKIPLAFAASGDKNVIPENTETTGLASWREGFPAITSAPFSEGGIAPKRADFNGIFNALSTVALWYQQGGFFVYDDFTNYEIGNIVIYSGEIYVCKIANGPASVLHSPANDTAETYWARLYPQSGTFNRMFFSQISGTYTAPRTGVYRITLKGGGGGGAYHANANTVGGAGGEGGTMVFYESLVSGTVYPYTIGAGGAAGVSSGYSNGNNGGNTTFNNVYSISGGSGGRALSSNLYRGGIGGAAVSKPDSSIVYVIPGQTGQAGGENVSMAIGGGRSGTITSTDTVLGAGGRSGGGTLGDAYNGADGYILIEYAG